MRVIRPTEKSRGWLRKEHPELQCSICAYCGAIGERECVCYDSTMSAMMRVPYSMGPQSCGFKWELKSAAQEAYDRMTYMGNIDKLPPMVQDAYAILKEGLEHDRKIRCNNEHEEERLMLSNRHNR